MSFGSRSMASPWIRLRRSFGKVAFFSRPKISKVASSQHLKRCLVATSSSVLLVLGGFPSSNRTGNRFGEAVDAEFVRQFRDLIRGANRGLVGHRRACSGRCGANFHGTGEHLPLRAQSLEGK